MRPVGRRGGRCGSVGMAEETVRELERRDDGKGESKARSLSRSISFSCIVAPSCAALTVISGGHLGLREAGAPDVEEVDEENYCTTPAHGAAQGGKLAILVYLAEECGALLTHWVAIVVTWPSWSISWRSAARC